MMTTLFTNAYSCNYQAATQSEAASCAKKANLVHSVLMCAVRRNQFVKLKKIIQNNIQYNLNFLKKNTHRKKRP